MPDNPLVSIIIPAYNAAGYMAETLASALGQSWTNKEVIVIDNGSTDDTPRIIEPFKDALTIITLPQNRGAAAARNAGLAVAKGQYIQFLDADDLLSANKIESQVAVLQGSANCLAICRNAHFYNGDDPEAAQPSSAWFDADFDDPVDFLIKLYAGDDVMPGYGGMVTIHSWLTPADIIAKAGGWNEELSVDDDGEFFCRVILASAGIRYADKALTYYRKFTHGNSLSSQKNMQAVQSSLKATDLKYQHLKNAAGTDTAGKIFAKHYWWAGVLAYPQYKQLSGYAINRAKALNYKGERYVGGKLGHAIAALLGWRAARYLFYYKQRLLK